jgi:hypothetical protein
MLVNFSREATVFSLFHLGGSLRKNPSNWRRCFLVGRPRPLGNWMRGGEVSLRARSYSSGGVRSSRNSGTRLAPTRRSSRANTLTVRQSGL